MALKLKVTKSLQLKTPKNRSKIENDTKKCLLTTLLTLNLQPS